MPIFFHTLPAKNMEYFLLQQLFAFVWGAQGVPVLEIYSCEQILLLGELINSNMKGTCTKTIVSVFFSIRLWLKFFLSLCRLLPYPSVCCIETFCTIQLFIYQLFWCGQQGISVVGASHRRTWRVVLVYHKVMYTKS